MTCPCGQNWCWICSRKIGGGAYPTHYATWNFLGCPGVQMVSEYRLRPLNESTQTIARSHKIIQKPCVSAISEMMN